VGEIRVVVVTVIWVVGVVILEVEVIIISIVVKPEDVRVKVVLAM
jgi:hypothetical protein